MPDHININHPDGREKWLREKISRDKVEAELKATCSAFHEANSDLESIFFRIERGHPVQLHYPNGRVAIIETVRWQGEDE